MFPETDQDRVNYIISIAKYTFGPQYDLYRLPVTTFDKMKEHIYEHKYFLEIQHSTAIDISPSFTSWQEYVFEPLIHAIYKHKLIKKYKRHPLEIYFHVSDYWHFLKEDNRGITTYEAVKSFKKSHKTLD